MWKRVILGVAFLLGLSAAAVLADAEQVTTYRLETKVENASLRSNGVSLPQDITTYTLEGGVDVFRGPFLYGGSLGVRRLDGQIGNGATATDIRATGAQTVLYGAWSPVSPVYLGLAGVVQRDKGVFDTIFGPLESSLDAAEIRPFVLAVLPYRGWTLRAATAVEVIHGRLAVETAADTVFTDVIGLAELAVTGPPIEQVVGELGVEVRRIFRQDVLLGGTERSPWSAKFLAKLSAPVTDHAALVLSGSFRAFDDASSDTAASLRLEFKY